jgi:hypothetical protein
VARVPGNEPVSLKSPEAALRTTLLASTAVSSLVSARVFPIIAPATASLPFITYRRTGIQREQSFSGPVGTPIVSVDLECLATTYEGARDLADKCRRALDGWGGTVGNVEVKRTSLDNEQDDFVQLGGADMPPTYRVTQSYDVLWQET